jgi:hypothetical protein
MAQRRCQLAKKDLFKLPELLRNFDETLANHVGFSNKRNLSAAGRSEEGFRVQILREKRQQSRDSRRNEVSDRHGVRTLHTGFAHFEFLSVHGLIDR